MTHSRRQSGNALITVMLLVGVSMLLLGAALGSMSNHKSLTHRYAQYTRSVAAAEGATEKVIATINQDYKNLGHGYVIKNLDKYRAMVPRRSEYSAWHEYRFFDAKGNLGRNEVEYTISTNLTTVSSQYKGLLGIPSTFRVISRAGEVNSPMKVVGAVEQQVQVSLIPLYQFAMFYNLDYECTALPLMNVNGPVHCNGDMYLTPHTGLTFHNDVTSSKKILRTAKTGNTSAGNGPVTFKGAKDGGVSTLTLPIGTNNTIAAVRQVVEIPPIGEDPYSSMGQQRFYNRADMLILVSNSNIHVSSGFYDGFKTPVLTANFITTNASFYNGREKKTVRTVDIDIGKFNAWNTNILLNPLRTILPLGDVRVLYVADFRTYGLSTNQPGIRLRNAQTLLPSGLTVVTPQPLYVLGHFNCPNAGHLGTTNTTMVAPASLVADAITLLSQSWNDLNGAAGLSTRIPVNTTVNAAFIAGIVQTSSAMGYSGGVENFPRFLEDWNGRTLTYNGSMVVMFESKFATNKWDRIGTYYNPPTRNWSFDTNFRDPLRLPPATPNASVLIRGKWAIASK